MLVGKWSIRKIILVAFRLCMRSASSMSSLVWLMVSLLSLFMSAERRRIRLELQLKNRLRKEFNFS